LPEAGYWAAHDRACANGEDSYRDPVSGYHVFTRTGLLRRGRCCGAGCRHCPFGHAHVAAQDRARRIQQPAWLTEARPSDEGKVRVLFWSGGKDSFLASRVLAADGGDPLVLLTTFDAKSRIIAHQEIGIEVVADQARSLDLPVIGVPLHPGPDYLDQLAGGLALVPQCTNLCFGDLHLDHIRGWREEAFARHSATAALALAFPVWRCDYTVLLADLAASGARCTISAVRPDLDRVAVGDVFDAGFIARLPAGVDPFGENGEFHTRIDFG